MTYASAVNSVKISLHQRSRGTKTNWQCRDQSQWIACTTCTTLLCCLLFLDVSRQTRTDGTCESAKIHCPNAPSCRSTNDIRKSQKSNLHLSGVRRSSSKPSSLCPTGNIWKMLQRKGNEVPYSKAKAFHQLKLQPIKR